MKPHRLATVLPPQYARRLQLAADISDIDLIDAITDELAACYPRLVRPRSELGRFRPAMDARAMWDGREQAS